LLQEGLGMRPSDRLAPSVRVVVGALCVTVLGAALYLGRPVLAPIVLAAFLALLLSGPVDAMARWRVPRVLAAGVATAALWGGLGAIATAAWQPATHWIQESPRALRALDRHAAPVRRLAQRLDSAARQVPLWHAPRGPAVVADPTPPASRVVLSWLPSAAISIVSVAVMTFLMLVEGPRLLGARAQHSRADVRRRWQAFAQVRGDLARYFGLIAAINLGLGVVSAATFAWLGLPNA
jgi:predicted PurR-regulated permease PerM